MAAFRPFQDTPPLGRHSAGAVTGGTARESAKCGRDRFKTITRAVLTADDEDHPFRTGDIGMFDDRGFLKIVDRKKDMVIVSGFNVYPNEVEAVATACPGVMECACVGRQDR